MDREIIQFIETLMVEKELLVKKGARVIILKNNKSI